MAQQALRRHENEGLPEGQGDLSPEDVEQIGRCGAVCHDPVDVMELAYREVVALGGEVVGIVRGHLEKTFEASA